MRSRVPVPPSPERSLTETLEYALTIVLVIVVITAMLQICGVHLAPGF
jgi:hypothetical protein